MSRTRKAAVIPHKMGKYPQLASPMKLYEGLHNDKPDESENKKKRR